MSSNRLIPVPWHSEPVYLLGVGLDLYPTETGLHIYCADWLVRMKFEWDKERRISTNGIGLNHDSAHTTRNPYRGWHHSANEAHKTVRGRVLAKRMGQSPGFPDFVHPRTSTGIELKVEKNKLSPEQFEWAKEFKDYHEVRTFNDFVDAVKTTI